MTYNQSSFSRPSYKQPNSPQHIEWEHELIPDYPESFNEKDLTRADLFNEFSFDLPRRSKLNSSKAINNNEFQLDQIGTMYNHNLLDKNRSFHQPISGNVHTTDAFSERGNLHRRSLVHMEQPPTPEQSKRRLDYGRQYGQDSYEQFHKPYPDIFTSQDRGAERGRINPAFQADYPTDEGDDVYNPPLPGEPSLESPAPKRRSLYRKNINKQTRGVEKDTGSISSVELTDMEQVMDVLATIRIRRNTRKTINRSMRGVRDEEMESEGDLEEQTGLPSLNRPHLQSLREKLQSQEVSTQELAQGLRSVEEETEFNSLKRKFKKAWQRKKGDLKGFFYQLELWASTFKEIEGKFGTATASYFRFTRWLMFLNVYMFLITVPVIVLPTIFSQNNDFVTSYNVTNSTFIGVAHALNCSRNYNHHIETIKFNETTTDKVLSLFKGVGWMEKTHLFYGLYHNLTFTDADTHEEISSSFNTGLGYMLAIGIAFIISFILIVKNSGKSVKEGVMDQEDSQTLYCNKVFSAWDFCITNERAATIKHANISYEFKADLEEQRLRIRRADRSTREKCRLYTIRFFINIFVVICLGASLYLIFWASDSLLDLQKKELSDFVTLIVEFLPSITITFLNVIIPLIFTNIVVPEDYSPVFELKITLFRTVLLRLASLMVLVISLYYKVLSVDDAKCVSSENVLCCGNTQWTNEESAGSIKCWETYIGQQFYKLALLDFAVVLFVTFFYEFPRTLIYTKYQHKKIIKLIGEQEFDLPKNVLDIVYSQTLCWLGMFFCPLIPLITMLKCFIVFYVKKLSLVKNCVPTKRPYKASRSNSFFMTVLLVSFILSAVPIGYMIGNIPPSQSCGPFRVYSRESNYYMFDVIRGQIETWHPVAEQVFSFLGTIGFFLPAMILLCLVMYGYGAAAQGYKKKQKILKDQLKLEGKDRQFLLARVNDVIKKGSLARGATSRNL